VANIIQWPFTMTLHSLNSYEMKVHSFKVNESCQD